MIDFSSINKLKTPCYVFDIENLLNRTNVIKSELNSQNINYCYAIKANPFLVRFIKDSVDYFEICSMGEYEICSKENIDANKMIISGVYKKKNDIEKIIKECKNLPTFTIESNEHLKILLSLAKKYNYKFNVLVRLTSGNQFGVSKKVFCKMLENNCQCINICGLHYYAGTQKKTDKIKEELLYIKEFTDEVKIKYNFDIKKIEYGAGLKVEYFVGSDNISNLENDKETIKETAKIFNEIFSNKEKTVELGRFASYDCGYFVTKVVDSKINDNSKFLICDGGINNINYYGQVMAMKKPYYSVVDKLNNIKNECDVVNKYTLCGALCTSADVIIKNVSYKNIKIGDRFIFNNVGAYSVTEASYLFLSRDMPYMYTFVSDKYILVRDSIKTYKINSLRRK